MMAMIQNYGISKVVDLSPLFGAAAMGSSSVSVVGHSLRPRRF